MFLLIDWLDVDDAVKMIPLNGGFHHPALPLLCAKRLLDRLIWKQFLDPFSQKRLCDPEQLPEGLIGKQNISIKISVNQRRVIGIQDSL
mgnify:CR=1 FL=1